MQISSRFTIAVHVLTCIEYFAGNKDLNITSEFLAGSVNVNPVIIRRVLLQLKSAGFINISRGKRDITLKKPLDEISLYDVFKAVDSVKGGQLFHFHNAPNQLCPVGKNIHLILDDSLNSAQLALENELKQISLAGLIKKIPVQN